MLDYLPNVSFTLNTDLLAALPSAAITFFGLYLFFYIFRTVVTKRLSRFASATVLKVDDKLIDSIKGIHGISFIIFALYFATQTLPLPNAADLLIRAVFMFTLLLQSIQIIQKIVISSFAKQLDSPGSVMVFRIIVNVVLWSISLMLLLSNLGVNVTSLVASLGIGGLAISLALQNVFSDLFSSFSILLDKPFEEGDFIVISPEYSGTVEKIGLKTTRLRTMSGEQLIISNSELAKSKVQNFKRMQQRRVVAKLTVTYETNPDVVEAIPAMLKGIVTSVEHADFGRAHFTEFLDSALEIELVYFINTREYVPFVDAQQTINLAILRSFAKEGINFAYPTQTVYMQKN